MKWRNLDDGYDSQIDQIRRQSPYERLGLLETATINEAKLAYRRKMILYHPDKTDPFMAEHGEEVVKLLNAAIEWIEDKNRG